VGRGRKITPLNKDEIEKMRIVGRLAAQTLQYIGKFVKAGVTTDELDKIVHEYTLSTGCIPATLGYHGYPKSICTSINQVVCHGVPDSTKLKDGDIINIDVTSLREGFHGDCSATFFVGKPTDAAKNLVMAAEQARDKGIEAIIPGAFTGDIGFAIDKFATRKGYSTVKEIGGHGIGKIFHDDPFVPSFGKKGKGDPLIPWHCITVEPMINEGSAAIKEFDIKGSSHKYYETADGKRSAQFEHTILVTDTGYEILTLP
jgi:methionyl aminopeptidase